MRQSVCLTCLRQEIHCYHQIHRHTYHDDLPSSQICHLADLVHLRELAIIDLRDVQINPAFCIVASRLYSLEIHARWPVQVCCLWKNIIQNSVSALTQSSAKTFILCYCYHLSSFGRLPDVHAKAISFVPHVACVYCDRSYMHIRVVVDVVHAACRTHKTTVVKHPAVNV